MSPEEERKSPKDRLIDASTELTESREPFAHFVKTLSTYCAVDIPSFKMGTLRDDTFEFSYLDRRYRLRHRFDPNNKAGCLIEFDSFIETDPRHANGRWHPLEGKAILINNEKWLSANDGTNFGRRSAPENVRNAVCHVLCSIVQP